MIYYVIVVLGVFACSVAQLLLKKSAMIEHRSAVYELLNWRVIIAYGIMFATLVTNIYAMSKGVLLKDMPVLEAFGYVFVPILSILFFGESIDRKRLLSIVLVLIGVIIFYM